MHEDKLHCNTGTKFFVCGLKKEELFFYVDLL